MDTERFDLWTRTFGGALSRRDALRAALGGGLGLALGRLAVAEDAVAKKHNKRKKHRKHKKGNGKGGNGGGGNACPNGRVAIAGRCVLACAPDTACGGGGICAVSSDGIPFCATRVASCNAIPVRCGNQGDCGANKTCTRTGCGAAGTVENRCVPFL